MTVTWEALVALDRTRPNLGDQLTGALRQAIADGRLGPGTRLPSTRGLAADLTVSRGVVVAAYEQLAAEGRLAGRRGSGTVVALLPAPEAEGPGPGPGRTGAPGGEPPDGVAPLRPGVPDLGMFPRAAWRRAYEAALSAAPDSNLDYGNPAGATALRQELARYLGRVRAARVDPDALLVTTGAAQAFGLLAGVLREHGLATQWTDGPGRGADAAGTGIGVEIPGATGTWIGVEDLGAGVARIGVEEPGAGEAQIGVEDPGSAPIRAHLAGQGVRPVPVPVDGDGLDVAALERTGLRAVLVTPAHQSPTGVVLAPARRTALVAWARRVGGLIVEDDYDAEFRYDRDPVGCLQGLAPDVVALVGSASKALAPALRMGWLAVPGCLLPAVTGAKAAADLGGPVLEQLAFARLLATGGYDRHLRRARRTYRQRRDAVVAALHRYLPAARVSGIAAGLHLVVELPEGVDDAAVADAARDAGLGPVALSRLRLRADGPTGLVIGYAAHSPHQLTAAIQQLAQTLSAATGVSQSAPTQAADAGRRRRPEGRASRGR